MQNVDSSQQALKKSILWNVVEPGDPYDIRKSMIARLPGDKKNFMGNKLELICLLQAAEIERLTLTLEDYRVKYREIERNELDRHSYEVQIRQLAAKAQEEQQLRMENSKLKNFIDRLNRQLQDLHSKYSTSSQLNVKYQQALAQVQSLSQQLAQTKMESNGLRQAIGFKTNELMQSQRIIRELQAKVAVLSQNSNLVQNYEEKFAMLGEEISRLNSVLKVKTEELFRLGERAKKTEEDLRRQREENQSLRANELQINQQISNLKFQLEKFRNQRQDIQAIQSQLRQANEQCERLMTAIRKLQLENDELSLQIKRYEDKHVDLTGELTEKERLVIQLQQQHQKYEASTTMITHELQRLNSVLKGKIDEINTIQLKCSRLTQENQFYISQVDSLQKQIQQVKDKYRNSEDLQRQLAQELAVRQRLAKENRELQRRITELVAENNKIVIYQQRTAVQIQEINRLNEIIVTLRSELGSLQGNNAERDRLQQDYYGLQRDLSQLKAVMAEEDIARRGLNDRIGDLTRKCNEYQKLVNELSAQVQRLNEVLKAKIQENSVLQSKWQQMSSQRQRLLRQIENQENSQARIDEYQNKFGLLSLEIQRLNAGLKSKIDQRNQLDRQLQLLRRQNEQLLRQTGEVSQLKRQIEELRRQGLEYNHLKNENIQIRRQIDSNNKITQATQEKLQQSRQQLKLKIEEFENTIRGYQRRAADYTVQIQRLNQILKAKVDELRQRDAEIRRLNVLNVQLNSKVQSSKIKSKEYSDLQRLNNLLRLKVEQAARWETSNHELIRRTEGLQSNLERAGVENQRLQGQLQQSLAQNRKIMRQVQGYKGKVNNIFKEVERLQQISEVLRRQNTDLKQQLSGGNLREKNQRLLEQIQRLKRVIEQQNGELKELRLILTQDYSLDKRIKEQLSLIVILFAEIQSLRQRIKDKQQEVEQVRRESLVPLKA